jgi:glycosyltransferase involved in cell wall biosynthesis
MKVLHLNHFDIYGGAARAAYRIHSAVRQTGVDSWMGVDHKTSDDSHVLGPRSKLEKALIRLRLAGGRAVASLLKTNNTILHSPSILNTPRANYLKTSTPNIIHLHWICGEMLSISAIGRLPEPVVWTLHDMWAFCGAEHYTEDYRWQDGYKRNNRPPYESGFDLNRWVWERKRKHWKHPFQIVTPSQWLAKCVRASVLLQDWPVTVIPNPIDTDVWAPVDQRIARSLLGLPQDEPLVLFGAMGGGKQPIKGFDLLFKALEHLADVRKDLHLVIFGENAPRDPLHLAFPIHYVGHLHDNISLRLLYSAADVMLIPSRQDNLPNTGVESLSCGTPVVAFNACGLPDIVKHKLTGYLAKAFDPEDLAQGIQWILHEPKRLTKLGISARDFALKRFSYSIVGSQYRDMYKSILH